MSGLSGYPDSPSLVSLVGALGRELSTQHVGYMRRTERLTGNDKNPTQKETPVMPKTNSSSARTLKHPYKRVGLDETGLRLHH